MLLASGCRQPSESARPSPPWSKAAPSAASPLRFRVQELPFTYERGETGAAWPVETTGGGVGLLDYDGDGRLDLFFAQGGPLLPPGGPRRRVVHIGPADVLLRNLGGGRFEDVSASVGLRPGDTARAWPWPTTTATAIPTST